MPSNETAQTDSDSDDYSAGWELIVASQHGRAATVSELLQAGTLPDEERDESGATALWNAAWQGRARCTSLLLQAGADANAARHDQATPLYMACQEDHPECMKLLLSAGAHPDTPVDGMGLTPLKLAAELGHAACLGLLLEAGAHADGLPGFSPPIWAAAQGHGQQSGEDGHVRCIQLLLEAGAAADLGPECSPLAKACSMGRAKCAKLLLEAGASVDGTASGRSPATPLYLATVAACLHWQGNPTLDDLRHDPLFPLLEPQLRAAMSPGVPDEANIDPVGAMLCVEMLVARGAARVGGDGDSRVSSADLSRREEFVEKALKTARGVIEAAPDLATGKRAARCVEWIVEGRGAVALPTPHIAF